MSSLLAHTLRDSLTICDWLLVVDHVPQTLNVLISSSFITGHFQDRPILQKHSTTSCRDAYCS